MKINVNMLALCGLLAGVSNISFGKNPVNGKIYISSEYSFNILQDEKPDYEKYKREQEAKIKENDEKIANLKNRMLKEKQKVKDQYNNRISEIEQKNKDMKERMAEHKKDENIAKWDAFKRDFNKGMDDLGRSIKDLASEYKK